MIRIIYNLWLRRKAVGIIFRRYKMMYMKVLSLKVQKEDRWRDYSDRKDKMMKRIRNRKSRELYKRG